MSVTGADGRVDDPGWPQIASVQTGFYGGAQRCFRICCSPLKSPAVVIDYRCFEKAVPNLVWLFLKYKKIYSGDYYLNLLLVRLVL